MLFDVSTPVNVRTIEAELLPGSFRVRPFRKSSDVQGAVMAGLLRQDCYWENSLHRVALTSYVRDMPDNA
jgi:hypothetical protein